VSSSRGITALAIHHCSDVEMHVVHELATDHHGEIEPTHCHVEHGNHK